MQRNKILKSEMANRNHSKNEGNFKKLMMFFIAVCVSVNLWGQAASDYTAGANAGDEVDQYNLGLCYFRGYGVTKDNTQAVYWFRKAAEQGVAEAQYNLGICYENGYGVTKDYTQAVYWWRKAAEQGKANAQYNLGECYANGSGVEMDKNMALYWYERAMKNEDGSLKSMIISVIFRIEEHKKEGYFASRAKL